MMDGERNEAGLVEYFLSSEGPTLPYGMTRVNDDGTLSEYGTVRMSAGTAAAMGNSPYGSTRRQFPVGDAWRRGRVNIMTQSLSLDELHGEVRRLRTRNLVLTRFLADRAHLIPGASDVLHSAW